jgi:hypothetical protein
MARAAVLALSHKEPGLLLDEFTTVSEAAGKDCQVSDCSDDAVRLR